MDKKKLVLYDGVCGLCDRTVQLLLRADKAGILTFAPLQGETAAEIIRRHPGLKNVDSIVFVRESQGLENVFVKSTAVLTVFRDIGGAWGLMAAFLIIPGVIRDTVYDWVARNRYQWFGKFDSCKIPDASVRKRFLP